MIVAKTYIGGAFTPGEIIPDDYPSDKLEWLKNAGAIHEIEPAPVMQETTAIPLPMDEEAHNDSQENAYDEEQEAPEIDVMAGVIESDKQEPVEKSERPKKKNGTKAK